MSKKEIKSWPGLYQPTARATRENKEIIKVKRANENKTKG
jgi:hypothetical protein